VWTKKNLFETKNAQRVLVEGNVLDGSWADGQVGFAVLLKSANQAGRCTWCRSTDITFRYNLIRNAAGAFNLAGREGSSPHPVGERLTRVLIEQNVVEGLSAPPFVGDPRLMLVLADVHDLTVRKNTMTSAGQLNTFLTLGPSAATNLAYEENVVPKGNWGLVGDRQGGGEDALKNVSGTVRFVGNVIIGAPVVGYPSTTRFVASLSVASGAGADRLLVDEATRGVVIP
jgi:hypothetical protein